MTNRSTAKAAPNLRPAQLYQLHVELADLRPLIWRRLLVPSWISLAKLHQLLQVAIGWTNSHLHQFKIAGADYGIPDDDWLEMSPRDDRRAILADCLRQGTTDFIYEYDFGDGWEHVIRIERTLPFNEARHYPLCLAGANACPPEDVGGTSGYLEFLRAIADPTHEEHDNYLSWCGGAFDPAGFDLNSINVSFRRIKIPPPRAGTPPMRPTAS